jgi:hypothetical protein
MFANFVAVLQNTIAASSLLHMSAGPLTPKEQQNKENAKDFLLEDYMSARPVERLSAGFTVVEILMASLLLIGLILAMTQSMLVGVRSNRSIVLDAEFNGLANTVALVLGRPEVCNTSNLFGLAFSGKVPVDLPYLRLGTSPVLQVGRLQPGFELESIKLDKTLASTVLSGTQTEWLVNLRIQARKTDPQMPGRKVLTRDFRVAMLVDTVTNSVVKCGGASLGPSLAENCTASGGFFDLASGKCDLSTAVCLRSGGIFDPVTKICDRSGLYYVVTEPGARGGHGDIDVLCHAGDIATGGGNESYQPADHVQGKPILSGVRPIGWNCQGNGVKSCSAICEKPTVATAGL